MNGDAWYILLSGSAKFKCPLIKVTPVQSPTRFNILEYVITELVLWQQIFDLVNVGLFKYLDNYNKSKELRCHNI